MKAFIVAALLVTGAGFACGPFFQFAVFTYQRHPDMPRSVFVGGKLGVLQPSYARSYLVVAYRHLAGIGFDLPEREQLVSYWKARATGQWDKSDTDWQERWFSSVDRVPGVPTRIPKKLTAGALTFNPDTNAFELYCAEDAYRNAVHTLDARVAQFGRTSAPVKEWALAQTQVFSNCDGQKAIPAPPSADLPQVIAKDRAYQIAAAHFYTKQYETAHREFLAIAADPSSPWKTIAAYLAVRVVSRVDAAAAAEQAEQILANPKLPSIHGMTYALLRRLMVEQDNPEYFHALSKLLVSHGQGNGLNEEMWEFTRLFDDFSGYDAWDLPSDVTNKKIDLKPLGRDDLPDWIATFQGLRTDSAAHSYSRWKSTNTPLWLVAAIARAQPKTTQARELIEAAEALPATSPGYQTAAFHRLRLLIDSGQGQAARPVLDSMLASGQLNRSSTNLFRSLRMRSAPDLSDFLRFAQRAPLMITFSHDSGEVWPLERSDDKPASDVRLLRLDQDSVSVLNRAAPLVVWQHAAENTGLAPNVHRDLVIAAFTRAVLLGAEPTTQALAPGVAAAFPRLAPFTRDNTSFGLAFLLLHAPESTIYARPGVGRETEPGKIDSYRDNWWCANKTAEDARSYAEKQAPPAPAVLFLTPDDRNSAAAEAKKLLAAGSGATYLSRVVLAFAKAHPDDPRVPEALHLAVRAKRYACDAGEDPNVTRDCFRFLQNRYPKSEWARKTPVWF